MRISEPSTHAQKRLASLSAEQRPRFRLGEQLADGALRQLEHSLAEQLLTETVRLQKVAHARRQLLRVDVVRDARRRRLIVVGGRRGARLLAVDRSQVDGHHDRCDGALRRREVRRHREKRQQRGSDRHQTAAGYDRRRAADRNDAGRRKTVGAAAARRLGGDVRRRAEQRRETGEQSRRRRQRTDVSVSRQTAAAVYTCNGQRAAQCK